MLAIDVESYSEAGYVWDADANKWTAPHGAASGRKGLPVVGANVYWEHPTAEVLVMRYRWTSWPEGVTARWLPGQPPPPEVQDWIAQGGPVEAHNAGFERLAFQHVLGPRHGFNVPAPHQWHCSAATARVNSYPASLAALGPALGLNTLKDADGKRLMTIFSMPRNPTKLDLRRRILPDDDPEQFARYDAYCATDVLTECAASAVMPPMTPAEREVWLYDQDCNTRGIQIDRAAVRDCIAVMDQALERYGAECEALTGGLGPSQVQKLGGWLMGRGVTLRSLDAEAVDAALRRDDLPADVRRVLELRAAVGSASVKKLYAMELQTSRDNRLRDTSVHHGTRTGRNTGQGVQVLNLPKAGAKLVTCGACGKPHKPAHASSEQARACPWCAAPGSPDARAEWNPESMVEPVLEVMRARSLDLVEWYFGDALLAIQGCVRSLFTAAPGHELIVSDYSAIEAVVAACITGEQWRIDTFKARRDIYLQSAAQITGRTYDFYADYKAQTGNHHPDRQKIGKVAELACLAPETLVLTDNGPKRIVDVSLSDRLWDGVEWVTHRGLVPKGRKRVVVLDGIRMTPDHLISCGPFWLEASRLVSNAAIRRLSLATGTASLWSLTRFAARTKRLSWSSALAARLSLTRSPRPTCGVESRPGAASAREPLRELSAKSIGDTPISAPTTRTAGGCLTASLLASNGATTQKTPGFQTMAGAVSWSTRLGETVRRAGELFSRTWSRSPVGTNLSLTWTAPMLTDLTDPETCGSSRDGQTSSTSGQCASFRAESQSWSDVYDLAYAGPRNRFTVLSDSGALVVHNCGFGGWIGAWRAFDPDEANKTDDDIKRIVLQWRNASPRVVAAWADIEGAAHRAVQHPGSVQQVLGLRFEMRGDTLWMRLLSGRELAYHKPRLRNSEKRPGTLALSYWTENSNPKYGALGWTCMDTWGSRLFENAVQAIACDILRHGVLLCRDAGYPLVFSVYDEAVFEVPEGYGTVEEVERLLGTLPSWATGWPVRATGGYRARRYRKDG